MEGTQQRRLRPETAWNRRVGDKRDTTKRPTAFKYRTTPTPQRNAKKRINIPSPNDEQTVAQLPSPTVHSSLPSPPLVPNSPLHTPSLVPNSPVPSAVNDSPVPSPPHIVVSSLPPTSPTITQNRHSSPIATSPRTPPSANGLGSPLQEELISPHSPSPAKRRHQIQEESEEEALPPPTPKTKKIQPVTPKPKANITPKGRNKGKQKEQEKTKGKIKGKRPSSGPSSSNQKPSKKPRVDTDESDHSSAEVTPYKTDRQPAHADTTQARRRIALGKNDQVLEFVLDKILSVTEEYMDEEDCGDIQPILAIWKSEIVSGFEEYQERARENNALSRNLKMLVKERKRLREDILATKKELVAAQQAVRQEEALHRKSEADRVSKETLHAFLTNFDVLLQTPLNEKTQTQVITDNVDSVLVTIGDNAHNLSRVRAINQTLQDCSRLLDVFASL